MKTKGQTKGQPPGFGEKTPPLRRLPEEKG